ncbi:MAG: hypothetical protein P4L00_12815 [Candidatus Acidoferrales bacterium]|nr:hypothetical protein [Candidatus Acidoferrales bacterium]
MILPIRWSNSAIPFLARHVYQSFEYVHAFVAQMTNADFAKLEPKFGPEANAGDIIYIIVTDDHEHLGQSVAYARVNGIVPPWTAAAMKAKADKQQKKQQ